ncbi:prepilin peptidase [Amycolatopsis aidingensis]|uniref:prepilin peptidase n=1 Tax=Amycolatopsis aidingensis TaxID=2842453 RepID=UPI001C0C8B61|nr:prepilin peptidase [Amycolatopsis aidingensis]
MTVGWLAAYASLGAAAAAPLSVVTRRLLTDRPPSVLTSWWLATFGTAALLVAVGWGVGPREELLPYGLVVVVAIPLSVIDWIEQRLPSILVGPLLAGTMLAFGGICLVRDEFGPGLRALAAMVAAAGLFLLLALAVPGGVGAGDVRLAAVVGAAAGWTGWSTVVGALLVALAVAIVLLAAGTGRRPNRDASAGLPFGPCLLAGLITMVVAVGG